MVNKKKSFKRVTIFFYKNSSGALKISNQIEEILNNLKLQVIKVTGQNSDKESKREKELDRDIIKKSDLIVAIGGDGTLLSAARRFGFHGIPLLGVNLGTLGFLTDIAPKELTNDLTEIIFGNFRRDERFFLEANIDGSTLNNIALNEITIHSKSISTLIEYEVYIDKSFVFRQRADGIIINTPTGSTAYSLSGNGPIVHPNVGGITLLPMFPHSLNTRPLIVDENSSIKVVIKGKRRVGLSLDGHKVISLKKDDCITITKAPSKLILIHPESHNFYNSCRDKLGWSLGIIQNQP